MLHRDFGDFDYRRLTGTSLSNRRAHGFKGILEIRVVSSGWVRNLTHQRAVFRINCNLDDTKNLAYGEFCGLAVHSDLGGCTLPRKATCPLREKLIDSPSIRAAS